MTLAVTILKTMVRGYKYCISPFLPSACRYLPTCSDYAHQALHHHGAVKGLALIFRRLGRCHPWGGSGYDPVPPVTTVSPPTPPSSSCSE